MKEVKDVELRKLASLLLSPKGGKKAKGRRKATRPIQIERCVITAGGKTLYAFKP